MPKLIVQTNPSAGDGTEVTLSERVVAANLESPHYTAQLIERVAWATADAEAIESGARASQPDRASTGIPSVERRQSLEDRQPSNAARRVRLAASALVLMIATVLSLASAALADSSLHGHRSRGQLPHRVADGVALQWYDTTNQTIAAAAYPEPVTQSRAWSVSWLAAARAIGDHGDSSWAGAS